MRTWLLSMSIVLLSLGLPFHSNAEPSSWSELADVVAAPRSQDLAIRSRSVEISPRALIDLGGGVIHYTTEAEFLAAGLSLTTDDLASSIAPPGAVCAGPTPLSSTTNDSCFAADDLQAGYVFNAVGNSQYALLLPSGPFPVPVNAVGPNFFADNSEFILVPPVDGFGAFLHGDIATPVDATVELFDAGNNSLGSVTVHGTQDGQFFGFTSSSAQVARVTVSTPSEAELFSRLRFGNFAASAAAPVPTLGVWSVLLLGALIIGIIVWRKQIGSSF